MGLRILTTSSAARFVAETNAFLARYRHAPGVGWPRKRPTAACGPAAEASQPGRAVTVRQVSAVEANAMVSRLIRSCEVVRADGDLAAVVPRCAIFVLIPSGTADVDGEDDSLPARGHGALAAT